MSATRCYCGEKLRPDGTCRHWCPPSASPKHLRAIDKARRLAEAKAREIGRGTLLNEKDMEAHRSPRASVRARRVAEFKRRRIAKIKGSQCQGQK